MVGTLGRSLSRWTVALCVMALVMGAWSETIFSDGFEDGMFWTYSAHEKYKGEFKIGEGKKVVRVTVYISMISCGTCERERKIDRI